MFNTNLIFFIAERQLSESELLVNILWPIKNMEHVSNLTAKCTLESSDFVRQEDHEAFISAQNNMLNPLSNFLVYKRKDAKIAWPSAVSLLCKK